MYMFVTNITHCDVAALFRPKGKQLGSAMSTRRIFAFALVLGVSGYALATGEPEADPQSAELGAAPQGCLILQQSDGSAYIECDPVVIDSVRSRGSGGAF